jgi:putative transposase
MPWKECHVEDERLRFVARLLDGEKMARLCAEFGISRKTGYKIYDRYKEVGLQGLTDRSRRPYRQANQLPLVIEKTIVRLKREYPHWGAPKIRERLRHRCPDVHCPAISTVHAVLDRHGLVTRRKRRRHRAEGTPLSHATQPNDLWCADYKGEFMLADRRYCYPLTITDFATRYLITCDALTTTQSMYAFSVFERTFQEFGLPRAIRTDNGLPFASGHALYGLSKLSVWWLRLGIQLEREATKPAAVNALQQQARFDAFVTQFNHERPHQALDMRVPGDLYQRSRRPYTGLTPLTYPLHDWTGAVTHCGRICYKSRKVNLSQVFAGQEVGVKQVDDHLWLVTFMDYDLGYFDDETCRLEPIANPFGPKVLPMSPE